MALSLDTPRNARSRGKQGYQAKNAEVLYFGALVGLLASTGRVQKWGDTAGLVFKGLCLKKTTGDTSASPVVECPVDESGTILEQLAVTGLAGTVADNDKPVYATDDGTFTLTPTINVGAVGKVKRWSSSTKCDVQLYTPEEYMTTGGYSILSFSILLATIADGDLMTNIVPGFAGRVVDFYAVVTKAATTGSKLSTLNLEIGTTNLTGGSLALTSANMTPLGAKVSASAITAGNHFSATDTLSIEAASTTAFAEGSADIYVLLKSD